MWASDVHSYQVPVIVSDFILRDTRYAILHTSNIFKYSSRLSVLENMRVVLIRYQLYIEVNPLNHVKRGGCIGYTCNRCNYVYMVTSLHSTLFNMAFIQAYGVCVLTLICPFPMNVILYALSLIQVHSYI